MPTTRQVPRPGLNDAKPESICHEADRIVSTDRNEDYGHPRDDFSRIADLWEAAFGWPVSAEDVGLAMILLKVSRELHQPKRDNRVDIAGYAKTLDMIDEAYNSDEVRKAVAAARRNRREQQP
jgi:hypothetical protein